MRNAGSGGAGGADRRTVLRAGGAGVLGLAGIVGVAGCSSGSPKTAPRSVRRRDAVRTDQVPLGGGKILEDAKIVLTQPRKGTFKAFTAICTHQGCTLNRVEDNVIHCPCHGSAFHATTGKVKNGPAKAPLKEYPLTVRNGRITVT